MNLSKIISKYKYLLFVLTIIYILLYILFFNYSNYSKDETEFLIYIKSYKIENSLLSINGKGKDNIRCYYTFKDEDEIKGFIKEYNFGDYIIINGSLNELNNNTIPNTFNYKKYALSNNEFYSLKINTYSKYKSTIRSYLYKRIKTLNNNYLSTFLYGSSLDNDDYKELGLSSLFTSFSIILILLKKNDKLYLSVLLFLLITTNFNIKIIIILLILLLKKLEVNYKDIVFIIALVKLLDRPLLFMNLSFYYSIIIYLTILINKKPLNNFLFVYLINLVLVPINIYSNYSFNIFYYLLTPLFSIIFIPMGFFISILLFLFPVLTFLLKYYSFLDYLSSLLIKLDRYSLIIMKPSIIFLIIIYILIFIFLYSRQIKYIFIVLIMYLSLIIFPNIYNYQDIYFLDVGEGDSILLRLNNLNILVDTGNKSEDRLITFFHSLGISKLDYLILTHGDLDHMGNANKIIEDIKVKKLYINNNEINENEILLNNYEKIDKKDIRINNIYLHMESYNVDNENSSSIMIYLKIDNIKCLLLGDSSINSTKTFIKDINDIDILKVSHHGSKYNTDREIINKLNPTVSIISVGKNNIYGHPNKEVLKILDKSKIYRTDKDGSIVFRIKNGELKGWAYNS